MLYLEIFSNSPINISTVYSVLTLSAELALAPLSNKALTTSRCPLPAAQLKHDMLYCNKQTFILSFSCIPDGNFCVTDQCQQMLPYTTECKTTILQCFDIIFRSLFDNLTAFLTAFCTESCDVNLAYKSGKANFSAEIAIF